MLIVEMRMGASVQVAEAAVTDLRVDGSLVVTADCPLGQHETAHASVAQMQLRGRSRGLQVFDSAPGKENSLPDWDRPGSGALATCVQCSRSTVFKSNY